MARVPQPGDKPMVVALAGEVVEVLFAEPDHEPELETQTAYEDLRTNPWLGVDDEPVTAQRLPGVEAGEVHRGRRGLCSWPSHQQWAVDRFGRSRDDRHT